jgi:hypothetical protein
MIDMRTPLAAGLRFASCALRDGPSMEVNTPARAELSIPVPVFATRFRRACFYYLTPSPLSLSVSNTDRMLRAATIGGRSRWGARPDGQISGAVWRWPVQPLLQKYSGFPKTQITLYPPLSCPRREGRWPSSRTLGRDAMDAAALLTNSAKADGEVVWS